MVEVSFVSSCFAGNVTLLWMELKRILINVAPKMARI